MRNLDYDIWIYQKYKNNIIPKLSLIIFGYLENHLDEVDKFISNKINIDDLLFYISQNTEINEPKPLINIVKEYVDKHAGIS